MIDTHVRLYDSTMTGAPILTGEVGKLKALLKAVLVDGFNSASVTITRVGDWAFVAHTAHGYPAFVSRSATPDAVRRVTIAGAAQSAYNGEHVIYRVDANTYKYEVSGSPATPATGSITSKRTPLGWSNVFDSGDKVVLRPSIGKRMYLRVDDSATIRARAVGYETMSDVDTGTGPFPTAAQMSGGLYWPKSDTSNSTARAWVIIGTERSMFVVVNNDSDSGWVNANGYYFMDTKEYRVGGDPYSFLISGAVAATNTSYFTDSSMASTVTGYYSPRAASQASGAVTTGIFCPGTGAGQIGRDGVSMATGVAVALSGLRMCPLLLNNGGGGRPTRALMPGLWGAEEAFTYLPGGGYAHGTTFSGAGILQEKTFMVVAGNGGNPSGGILIETSDTWDERA